MRRGVDVGADRAGGAGSALARGRYARASEPIEGGSREMGESSPTPTAVARKPESRGHVRRQDPPAATPRAGPSNRRRLLLLGHRPPLRRRQVRQLFPERRAVASAVGITEEQVGRLLEWAARLRSDEARFAERMSGEAERVDPL